MKEFGHVVWLTGCPSSGKSTISDALTKKIKEAHPGLKIQQLDGDIVRGTAFGENTGFSPDDRALHIKRMGELARMFADHGILVLCSFISPDGRIRQHAKDIIGDGRFTEVYVKASKEERMKRDVKGLYAKAKAGKISNLTGFNAPYDEPEQPHVVCDTDAESVMESTRKVFDHLFREKAE
ncbi:MAG: adenylyl-sulfate kinase [Nanoarchaeota archaeon]|nr:adenylyl-sulfate kinase [Nanoarchaeota archaeon]